MEEVKKTKTREKYENFLKEFIKENCDENGYKKIYYDYTDKLNPDTIYKTYNVMKYDKTLDFDQALEQVIDDDDERYIFFEDNLIDELEEKIKNSNDEDLLNEYKNTEDIVEDLSNAGYMGIDYNIEELLNNSNLKFNIMFATDNEKNYDMSAISNTFMQDREDVISENKDILTRNSDNSLTYLIQQQGHSIKEVLDDCYDLKRSNNKFIKSVSEELDYCPRYSMNELTCLVQLSGEQISDFFNTLEGRSEDGNIKNFEFNKDVTLGLFNEWNGSGSLLEIELEKPFIVSKDMIRNFQIEGEYSNHERGYTVDEVYGLVSSCWKEDCLTSTTKGPELYKEDNEKTIGEFAKEMDKEIEENEGGEEEDER